MLSYGPFVQDGLLVSVSDGERGMFVYWDPAAKHAVFSLRRKSTSEVKNGWLAWVASYMTATAKRRSGGGEYLDTPTPVPPFNCAINPYATGFGRSIVAREWIGNSLSTVIVRQAVGDGELRIRFDVFALMHPFYKASGPELGAYPDASFSDTWDKLFPVL